MGFWREMKESGDIYLVHLRVDIEQFFNERLLVDGAKDRDCSGSVDRDDRREAEEMRAAEEMAKKAMAVRGSSLMHMTALIEDKVYLKALPSSAEYDETRLVTETTQSRPRLPTTLYIHGKRLSSPFLLHSSSPLLAMDLHVFFLPFLAPGHMIPMVDLARVFAGRGVRSTIVTTTANVPLIQPTLDLANADDSLRHPIQILVLSFPSFESGTPLGHENLQAFNNPDVTPEFTTAINMLEDPFKQLLQAHRPDGIVADIFYAWASDVAKDFGIPRLVFHGSNTFCTVVSGALRRLKLHESEHAFDVPGLPHRFQMTWSQLPEFITKPDDSMKRLGDGYRASYGMLVNSFYELESDYIDLVKKGSETKLWHVGPLSLHNQLAEEKAARGNTASISSDECLTWLDSKKPRSVLYVCFGSLGQCTTTQLHEIALGLEASDHPFIWVVSNAGEPSEWLPERFEERVIGEGKGLLIRGWAPQLLILNHEAVGGFVTHCGWNSCLEGVSAGVPMVTWPLFAEQFINEKLVVDVLRVGIAVGATVCSNHKKKRTLVKGEAIKKAVDELMGSGEEAESRRKRVGKLKELANKAVEGGGSSDTDMSYLLHELINLKATRLGNTVRCSTS
ncbi:hypothetical protein GW17_00017962 [Ensete ventricosum]|nr:hypothetical protein GW17_00017962 [Ensete ventricosum]